MGIDNYKESNTDNGLKFNNNSDTSNSPKYENNLFFNSNNDTTANNDNDITIDNEGIEETTNYNSGYNSN